MALADLFDHMVVVWRPDIEEGSLGEEVRVYSAVLQPADYNACVNRPKAPITEAGPGLAAVGTRTVYMPTETDVRERDVLELLLGPDAPELLEVDAPPTRPRDHHLELTCRLWNGKVSGS